MDWLVIFAIGIAGAVVTGVVAQRRGRDKGAWVLLGLLCWPLALGWVLLTPPVQPVEHGYYP